MELLDHMVVVYQRSSLGGSLIEDRKKRRQFKDVGDAIRFAEQQPKGRIVGIYMLTSERVIGSPELNRFPMGEKASKYLEELK